MKNLVWFRRDLRLKDNTALSNACKDAEGGVVAVYVMTPDQWAEHDDAHLKVNFWLGKPSIAIEVIVRSEYPATDREMQQIFRYPCCIDRFSETT